MLGPRLRLFALCVLLCITVAGGSLSPAFAGSHQEQSVTLDDAIALVREKSGGKVLRAESTRDGDRVTHEIRVLTADGHVRTYVVDGRTGKVE